MSETVCRSCEELALKKPDFPPGPWHDEPDYVTFEHAGLPCILHRTHMGHWCGYAAVPPGHPCHGLEDGELYDRFPQIRPHGGVTYTAKCAGHISHVPKPGEPDDVWWLGFDCAHCDDLSPGMAEYYSEFGLGGEYRDLDYVRSHTESLAEQLAALSASLPDAAP